MELRADAVRDGDVLADLVHAHLLAWSREVALGSSGLGVVACALDAPSAGRSSAWHSSYF